MKSSVSLLHKFKLTFVGLMLAGLCWLMPTQSHAQSSTVGYGLYDAPAGPYATPAVAQSRVETQMSVIKAQLGNLNPQSTDYKYGYLKYQFYSIIRDQLADGKTVKVSLETALQFFATDVCSELPKSKKEEFKQEALNLLKP